MNDRHADTTTAPERIWADRTGIEGAVETGVWADTIRHMGGVEYIRADLCRAPLANTRPSPAPPSRRKEASDAR